MAAFAAGIAAGVPALLLAIVTLLRDWSARDVARAFPALAWGQHSPLQMAIHMGRIAVDTWGLPFFVLLVAVAAAGVVRRDLAVITAVLGVAATFAGISVEALIECAGAAGVTVVCTAAEAFYAELGVIARQGRRR